MSQIIRIDCRPELNQNDSNELKQYLSQLNSGTLKHGLATLMRILKSDIKPDLFLVSLKVQPHFVIQQILNLCSLKNCRILIVHDLNEIIQSNFSSLAVTVPCETIQNIEFKNWIELKLNEFKTKLEPESEVNLERKRKKKSKKFKNKIKYQDLTVKQIRKNPNKKKK